ncbi:Uric acid degradation bifunctional protein TTL [Hirschfeldia incana]|nr:Uric acid degradation bifunctional protein TTL [Hirschfeldia incana]
MATTTMEMIREEDWKVCCGSSDFAKLMAKASPFNSLEAAIESARDIWFNQVNVAAWLEAFAAHPQIGKSPSPSSNSDFARRSVTEQSTAFATTSASALEELAEWNVLYRQKFGFIFIICASGRTHAEMLAELKGRYANRPIVELEIAAKEQMKITELRMAKLFSEKAKGVSQAESTKPQGILLILPNPLLVKLLCGGLNLLGVSLISKYVSFGILVLSVIFFFLLSCLL